MLTYYSPLQSAHAPETEFFRGERVTCFENPSRAAFVLSALQAHGHAIVPPDADSGAVLTQVHSSRYLAFLESAWARWVALDDKNAARQPFPSVWPVRTLRSDIEPDNFIAQLGLYSMDNGTPLAAGTWGAAKAGADCTHSAALALTRQEAPEKAMFCLTRPPGHHAGADFMGGYCFINIAAVAAQSLHNRGCQRVAILDVDYHHGNGTQSIFYDRADVLYVSIHGDPKTEYPFYLGHADETGADAGAGYNLNLPLPAGSDTPSWFAALDTAMNRIRDFGADALVVSLGLDTYVEDPISTFTLQSEDFVTLGVRLATLKLPTARVLGVFEGKT